jgi:hypothetical protein
MNVLAERFSDLSDPREDGKVLYRGITHNRAKLYVRRHAPAGKPLIFPRLSHDSMGQKTET